MRQKFQIFNSKTIFAPASSRRLFCCFFLNVFFSCLFFYDSRFVVVLLFLLLFSRLNNLQIEAQNRFRQRQQRDNGNRMLNESFSCRRSPGLPISRLSWSPGLLVSRSLGLFSCSMPQQSLLAVLRWQNENKQRAKGRQDKKRDETRQTNEQNATPSFRVGQSPQLGQQQHIWHLGAGDKAIKTPTKPNSKPTQE